MSIAERLAEPLRLLERVVRNDDVRRLELAWTASNLSNRASAIAIAVYAYDAGGAGAVGVVWFVRLAAAAATSPWLSVLADRRPRRQVLLLSDFARCVLLATMAALVFADAARLAVYALAVLDAIAEPLFRSAQAALTPSLVSTPEELTAANVIASAVESVGLFVGPALGALLLAATDVGTVFVVTAGLLLVAMALVARIGMRASPPRNRRRSRGRARCSRAGGRSCRSASCGSSSDSSPHRRSSPGCSTSCVVVLAIELLDLGAPGVGWLDGTVGIGAVLGILAVAGVAGRQRLAGTSASPSCSGALR